MSQIRLSRVTGPNGILPRPIAVRALVLLIVAALSVEVVEALVAPGALSEGNDLRLYIALIVAAAVVGMWRVVADRAERLPWLFVGLGLVSTVVAEFWYFNGYSGDDAPVPSVPDAFFLATYPLLAVGLVLLVRNRLTALTPALWLDALIAGVATTAVGAAVLTPALRGATGSGAAEIATNLAYPLGDLMLLAGTVVALALTGWRPDRSLILVAAANFVTGIADVAYLLQQAAGTYEAGTVWDALWPAGCLLFALAAWQQPGARGVPTMGARMIALPVAFGGLSLVVVALFVVGEQGRSGAALALGAIALVIARFAIAQRESARMLMRARADSLTDPLTGIGNRRALWSRVDELCVDGTVAVVLDLDGFKDFNDRYGHLAGDQLLIRVAQRLVEAAKPGHAFRLGGDEFCAIGPFDEAALTALLDAAGERGRDFAVSASMGSAAVEDGPQGLDAAMRRADDRMYARKRSLLELKGEDPGVVRRRRIARRTQRA